MSDHLRVIGAVDWRVTFKIGEHRFDDCAQAF
jgi:hypothetical protein